MGLISWFKSLRSKKETNSGNIQSIPILRTETPEKIIETRIKPIKIPTIMDLGQHLGLISRHLSDLKDQSVTKTWFTSEYEDTGEQIILRLSKIEKSLSIVHNSLTQISKNLSDFTKGTAHVKLSKGLPHRPSKTSDQILELLKNRKKMRYKELFSELSVSDPTLSKHLKNLCNTDEIKRKRTGRAVYYELSD